MAAAVTVLSYSDIGRFLFAQGSDVPWSIVRSPLLWPSLTLGVMLVAAVRLARRTKAAAAWMLLAVMWLAWAGLGRAIGFHSDGRIRSAWWLWVDRTHTPSAADLTDGADAYACRPRVSVTEWTGEITIESPSGAAAILAGPLLRAEVREALERRGYRLAPRGPGACTGAPSSGPAAGER
jgi:hypothetical protein